MGVNGGSVPKTKGDVGDVVAFVFVSILLRSPFVEAEEVDGFDVSVVSCGALVALIATVVVV